MEGKSLCSEEGDLSDEAPQLAENEEGEQEEVLEAGGVDSVWEWKPSALAFSHEAKLRELLGNLCCSEIKIYSDASKEFIEILKGESGKDFLFEYVRSSPRLSELMEVWRLHQGKPGFSYVLKLVLEIVHHAFGRSRCSGISRNVDNFARFIVVSNLEDLYAELKSGEGKRQAAALFLLAAIVKRGVIFASELAKNFLFSLPAFQKLAGLQGNKGGIDVKRRTSRSVRRAFVDFALSFLEVGNPRLLRWILQQKEMYSGVLRGLGNDDEETVIFVLSVVRDKLLCADSLVPPGLRSVLFGSVTLEQLSFISGNPHGGDASDLAHEVLLKVCTDPCNGLMPHGILKGNVKRLSDLMMKLKATETIKHKQLLLAIVKGRPRLCSLYMDEFPYHLEPRASPQWYSAISLAADLVSSVNFSTSFSFLDAFNDGEPPSLENKEVQYILKCIMPQSCSRSVINKGLLHSDILVKHGSIRLVLEALKLLDSLSYSMGCLLDTMHAKNSNDLICLTGFLNFSETSMHENDDCDKYLKKWTFFRGQIQDEVRTVLPDPQVLLKLLSSFTSEISRTSGFSNKRCLNTFEFAKKKSKSGVVKDVSEVDIVIGVTDSSEKVVDADVTDTEKWQIAALSEIWGPNSGVDFSKTENIMPLFLAKLLDSLKLYLRVLPLTLEGSFDFMKILTNDPSKLSITLQESALSLLLEYAGLAHEGQTITRVPPVMYKSLHLLLDLLIFSPNHMIRSKVFTLAKTAMISTGAFDHSISEIEAWLLLLPGYWKDTCCPDELQGALKLKDLFSVVISFFCDAVSTMANNLYKYLDQLRVYFFKLSEQEDICPDFSPLVICILQKCIRVLESDSRTFNLSEKSMISLYVSNTLRFILHTQVDLKILPGVITLILNEKLNEPLLWSPQYSRRSLCEWRPLHELLLTATAICHQQDYYPSLSPKEKATKRDVISLYCILNKVTEFLKNGDKDGLSAAATAMCFSIICTNPEEILENLPILMAIVYHLPTEHIQFLSFVLFQCELLGDANHLWDRMFLSNLEKVGSFSPGIPQESDTHKMCDVSEECMAVGFSLMLENVPFYALFSGIVKTYSHSLFKTSKVRDLLCAKLGGFIGDWSLPLRFVLFQAYQIRLQYKKQPSSYLEQMFELASFVLNCILEKVLDQSSPSGILEVVDLVIQHPVVALSILHSFNDNKFNEGDLEDGSIHQMDAQILQLLKRLGESLQASGNVPNLVFRVFTPLMENLISLLKEQFNIFIMEKDFGSLLPTIYIFRALMQFVLPFRLTDIVYWMLCKIEANMDYVTSIQTSFLSFFFEITSISLQNLCNHLNDRSEMTSSLHGEPKNMTFSVTILKSLYNKVLDIAIRLKSRPADSCLLKLVQVIQKSTCSAAVHPSVIQLYQIVINSSSMKLIIHCIYETSKIKARILFHLVEASPLHRSLFGMAFSISVKDLISSSVDVMWPPEFDMISSNYSLEFSDDDLLLLLPAVLSYTTSVHKGLNFGGFIPLYSKVLIKGFENWQTFTSGKVFHEDFSECKKPTSTEEFLLFFRNTYLGKAICMLHSCFLLNLVPMKKRYLVDIFNSLFDCSSSSDQLFDVKLNKVEDSVDSFNIVNRAMAKIYFAQLLLITPQIFTPFSEIHFGEVSEGRRGNTSSSKNSVKLRFLDILVHSLNNLVSRFHWNPETTNDPVTAQVFRLLELHILGTIVLLSIEMKDFLFKLPNISFLKPLVRTLLLHRFDDPNALRSIRLLVCNLETRSTASEILALLLGHSEFVDTLIWNPYNVDYPSSINVGTLLLPVASIFKLLDEITKKGIDDKSPNFECKIGYMFLRKLELIKLLRVLFFLKNPKEKVSVNSKEFLSLLLSGYAATLSEIDLHILHFIHEIQSLEESDNHDIAEMDYLWGKSAVKLRHERNYDEQLSTHNILNVETEDEKRKRIFRENLPLDSKRCMMTALNFCFNRGELTEPISLKNLLHENSTSLKRLSSSSCEMALPYDPGFLLPLSVHCLRRGYVEPMEFVRLGLLSVVLVSISSSDEDIRRLGYEALAIFKAILEGCRRSKDILQLQLLLAYLQNGISDENQKIPSLTAVFSAEASFILLDPSHNSFQVFSKFLMHSSRADLKDLPLFNSSLVRDSINFKGNFVCILKLLHLGLNSDDDARIVIRKNLFEHLMSLYVSCLSDLETKALILQIMKKSIKLGVLSSMLAKRHGLIPWLCSIISLDPGRLLKDQKELFLNQVEVINDVVQSGPIREWLKEDALEQLSDLSQELHSIFIKFSTLFKDHISIGNCILSIIRSTLEISEERDTSRPRFFLSMEDLMQLCRALDSINTSEKQGSTVHLGLRTMLSCRPPLVQSQTEKSKLLKLANWALSVCHLLVKTHPSEEPVLSKLLRWLTASIITGITSGKTKGIQTEEDSLEDLLGKIDCVEHEEHDSLISKTLGGIILHIRYLIGRDFSSGSSSVVTALSFLLFPSHDKTGTNYKSIISSLCGKIRRPSETNPCWKWVFSQPWKDLSRERTQLQDLEEEQACQALLLFFSDALGDEPGAQIQLLQEVEGSGLFKWEKRLLL